MSHSVGIHSGVCSNCWKQIHEPDTKADKKYKEIVASCPVPKWEFENGLYWVQWNMAGDEKLMIVLLTQNKDGEIKDEYAGEDYHNNYGYRLKGRSLIRIDGGTEAGVIKDLIEADREKINFNEDW